jgi:peptidoglycan hydrolase-like protein with peptidoglycan-binding domain
MSAIPKTLVAFVAVSLFVGICSLSSLIVEDKFISSIFLGEQQVASIEGAGSGLVGWWKFDEGSGTTAQDVSGYNKIGTISGGSYVSGKFGGGLGFQASGMVNFGADLIGTQAVTLCGWINLNNNSINYIASNGAFALYTLGMGPNEYKFGFQSSGGGNAFSDSTMQVGTWNHFCLIRGSTGIADFYVNGVVSGGAQNSGAPISGYTPFVLGNRYEGDKVISGVLDDFRLYGRELSSEEIVSVFNSVSGSSPVNPQIPPASDPQTPTKYSISLSKDGSGTGTVTGGSINCGQTCSMSDIAQGTSITLSASPNSDSNFTSWSGACSGSQSTCSITVDGNKNVTASFDKKIASVPPQSGEIISSDRRTDWTKAGVEGGIPTRTRICATIGQTGLKPTDVQTGVTTKNINDALASCPAGQVVFLQAGTYNLSTYGSPAVGINFGNSVYKGITLRGAGPDKTIINLTGLDNCGGIYSAICVKGSDVSSENMGKSYWSSIYQGNWIGGLSKNSTTLTLQSIPFIEGHYDDLEPGMVMVLDQFDDVGTQAQAQASDGLFINQQLGVGSIEGSNNFVRLSTERPRSQQQHVKIKSINGARVEIATPIHASNWSASKSPQAWSTGFPAEMNGIEDLSIENKTNNSYATNIGFFNVYNGWVKNVRSLNGARAHIIFSNTAHSEIRDSYIYGSKLKETSSYGYELRAGSDNLIINNIFDKLPAAGSGLTTSSVFAYNSMPSSDFWNYNDHAFWMQPTMNGNHDAGTILNLYEGNLTNGIQMDIFHGSSGLITYFRNRITGYETRVDVNGNPMDGNKNPCTRVDAYGLPINSSGQRCSKQNTKAVTISAIQRMNNLVGNVLGTRGFHTQYEVNPSSNSSDLYSAIYYLGAAGLAGQWDYSGVLYDRKVASTILRWGNFDYVSNRTRWETSEVPGGYQLPKSLPSSLFLTSRPAFFTTPWGTTPWPPIGPDVSGLANNIPAKLCYDNTPKDANGILAFNANNCYGTAQASVPIPPASNPPSSPQTPPASNPGGVGASPGAGTSPITSNPGGASPTTGGGGSNSGGASQTPSCTPRTISITKALIPTKLLTLRYGMTSTDVKTLQIFLNDKGFTVSTTGPGSKGQETFYFGPATQAALNRYNSAPATNIVTVPCTNTTVPATTTTPTTPVTPITSTTNRLPSTFRFTRSLSPNTTSTDVKNLQIFLNDSGFTVSTTGPGSKGQETFYFGPATKSAVIRFQEYYKSEVLTPNGLLKGTGLFGPASLKKANGVLGR